MSCHGGHEGHGHKAEHGPTTQNNRLLYWGMGLAGLALVVWLVLRSGGGNFLAYGMLLLCPLMHLFMMRGHGHGHGQAQRRDSDQS